jgi:hypothetical protein
MDKQNTLGFVLVGVFIIILSLVLVYAGIVSDLVWYVIMVVGAIVLFFPFFSSKQDAAKSEQDHSSLSPVRPVSAVRSASAGRALRVFLCHSSGDKPIVRELYRKLSAEGWIDAWLDEVKIIPGQTWEYEIEKALDNADAVIVTLSKSSVSKEGYVQKEFKFVLDIALEKPEGTIYILPVRLDDCERPRRLRSIQGIDYFPPEQRGSAYARLRSSLVQRAQSLGIIAEPK